MVGVVETASDPVNESRGEWDALAQTWKTVRARAASLRALADELDVSCDEWEEVIRTHAALC